MKHLSLFIFSITILTSGFVTAQSKSERATIISLSNPKEQQKAFEEINKFNQKRQARVSDFSITNNVPIISYSKEGELILLQDVDILGNPVYVGPYNFTGVLTIGADHLYADGDLGIDLTGDGIMAGIWDGGYPRSTHQDLVDRIVLGESGAAISGHGTHVGGTIIGDGTGDRTARGVAFGGSLISYDFDGDTGEMFQEAARGMLVSNHSYGRLLQGNVDAILGKYDFTARIFDLVTSRNEYYLPVVSAGNDRNDGFNNQDSGYDLLTDRALAKNVITVGAVNSVLNYINPDDVNMSSFSSWGPTDDGRIKPDIVAKGVSVGSTESFSDTAYGNRQGTSMSSPMVTGGVMLLQELHNNLNNNFMKSASVRALILSTTKEAGDHPGPDYKFGWGLLDLERAAQVLLGNGSTSILEENNLINGETYSKRIVSSGDKLTISLAWTDLPGIADESDIEDDPSPSLINDLDVVLLDENGNEFFPWKLDVSRFNQAATTGINNVDNIEIIEIDAPLGSYTVMVSHKGELVDGDSNYSLVIDGIEPGTLSNSREILETIKMYPNPASTHFNIAMSGQLTGQNIYVNIYDTLGKVVSENKFQNTGSFNERINTSMLRSGVYIVKISDGTAASTKKLIID